ncbi:MAG: aminoacyl-histidine dipeptidase [Pseudomonadota bacterium]
MSSPFCDFEPKTIWTHFEQLLSIPRPSKHEERVIAHIKKWAQANGWETRQDQVGNLVVRIPATAGHENAKPTILQGHVDMVAEKDKTTTFDFLKDPIQVVIKGDWVVAERTTLGADNGIGVAAMMASADAPDAVHGPLDLLFTIDEETALTGASNLDGKLLSGRALINLDSEEDDTMFVGCAGGCTTEIAFPAAQLTAVPAGYSALRLEVTGLKGGHSGLCINENRGNSLKTLARVLTRWLEKQPLLIHSVEGGNKHNAIPREAAALVLVPSAFAAEAKTIAGAVKDDVLEEIKSIDPELAINVDHADAPARAASAETSLRLVRLLAALPHGVITMSRDIQGMPETSTNLAVIRTDGERILITSSSRSSVAPALRAVLDQIAAAVMLAGGTYTEVNAYPGWKPEMASPLLKICRETYRELRGQEPKVTAIHAGLECGIIGEKIGGKVDMISYGPTMEGVHAPGERLNIPSVARFWELHKAVLRRLA